MREESWKHLYGVIGRTKETTLGSQRQGSQIFPVTYKELSALVSDAPSVDYRGLGKDLLLKRLLDHQRVIESVMHSSSIIPFRFGSIARTEEEVIQILIQGYSLFETLLQWVGERVELEVAAVWDKDIFKVLYEEEAEIQSIQKAMGTKTEAEAVQDKIKLGKLVRQCLLKKKVSSREQIFSKLKDCSESYCDHEVKDDLMILNAAFLVRKEMENEFDRQVRLLDEAFLGKVSFKVIGPLPLYSFKGIGAEWVDGREIRDALALLEVDEHASPDDVRSAYYRKAKAFHPDKTGESPDRVAEFEKAVKAFRLLVRYQRTCSTLPGEGRTLLMEAEPRGLDSRAGECQFHSEAS
jgi:DnaJ-domain-containing protein 1